MAAILDEMKALYAARKLSQIDPFIDRWIADNCVVMGTALGELMSDKKDVRELFYSDLRYWYDLDINPDAAEQTEYGEYILLRCPAVSSYTIHENTERYNSYINWCDEIIADDSITPAQKGAQVAYILDTLLSSRWAKKRRNELPLTISILMRDDKAVLISFAFNKDIDSADHFIGDGASTTELYAKERELIPNAHIPELTALIGASYGYEDVQVALAGEIFYGAGTQTRRDTLDEAITSSLADFKQEDAYRTLFELRLRIAYLQKAYAIEPHPKAVTRFFGIYRDGGIDLMVPVYPLNYYMEYK